MVPCRSCTVLSVFVFVFVWGGDVVGWGVVCGCTRGRFEETETAVDADADANARADETGEDWGGDMERLRLWVEEVEEVEDGTFPPSLLSLLSLLPVGFVFGGAAEAISLRE